MEAELFLLSYSFIILAQFTNQRSTDENYNLAGEDEDDGADFPRNRKVSSEKKGEAWTGRGFVVAATRKGSQSEVRVHPNPGSTV